MPHEDLEDLELMLNRFNRLLTEVMTGETERNSFRPWEIEILLDMETCEIERRRRLEILRQYRRAVGRQMQRGPGPPMKLSAFLVIRAQRAAAGRTQSPVFIASDDSEAPESEADLSRPLLLVSRRKLG
jgi:hypothetical protein